MSDCGCGVVDGASMIEERFCIEDGEGFELYTCTAFFRNKEFRKADLPLCE